MSNPRSIMKKKKTLKKKKVTFGPLPPEYMIKEKWEAKACQRYYQLPKGYGVKDIDSSVNDRRCRNLLYSHIARRSVPINRRLEQIEKDRRKCIRLLQKFESRKAITQRDLDFLEHCKKVCAEAKREFKSE
jgi:hypothetical protein